MIQNAINNWRTTSLGLTMVAGAWVHMIYALRAHSANENTWSITIGATITGIGLIVAGDAGAPPKQDAGQPPPPATK